MLAIVYCSIKVIYMLSKGFLPSNTRIWRQNLKIYYTDETWAHVDIVIRKVCIDNSVTSANNAFLRGLSTGPSQTFGAGQRLILLRPGNINITEYNYFEDVTEEFAWMKSQKKCFTFPTCIRILRDITLRIKLNKFF